MDVLTAQEMIAREEEVFRSGTSAGALMDAAGRAMADVIRGQFPRADRYLILVGKGNNGGDGLVVALHLASTGRPVEVVLAAPEDGLRELSTARVKLLRERYPAVAIGPWRADLSFPGSDGLVIDALLGLQAKGPLRGVLAEVVAAHNAARVARFFRTVALDLPTGLAALEAAGEKPDRDTALVADVTLAVGFAKDLLCRETAAAWVGRLEVIPWSSAKLDTAVRQVLVPRELAALLPRRSAFSFKGDYGHLTVIAGSLGFTGAPVLCTQAAQAMGAGLLSVVTKTAVVPTVAAQAPPEAMISGWAPGAEPPKVVEKASTLIFGPGLGVDEETATMLCAVMTVGCPVVIDADGLNVLAKNRDLLKIARGHVVLTPHPGEMARLIGRKFGPEERESVARAFVEEHNVTLVLKGTRTLVAARGQPLYVNTSGNPGLSTGGSGDTLSGIIGALLAQKLAPLDAARLGVWLHGHAADLVLADRGCEEGFTPTMVSAALGRALVSLRCHAAPRAGLVEEARLSAT